MDVLGQRQTQKKPAELVPCGLSVLHRTYPDHHLVGWRPCDLCFNILIYIGILCLFSIEGSIMEPLSETAERLTSNYAKR